MKEPNQSQEFSQIQQNTLTQHEISRLLQFGSLALSFFSVIIMVLVYLK